MAASLLSRLDLQRLEHPGRSDRAHVATIADQLITDLQIAEPPVNLRMVASMLDILKVVAVPGQQEAGCLVGRPDGRFEIRLRASDPRSRHRFTIGHECSHTFFPGFAEVPQFRCSPTLRPVQELDIEALCDIGASELLLPRRLLLPTLLESSFGLTTWEEIAGDYDASLEATGHRIVPLWPEPAALLIFHVSQKPKEHGTSAPPVLRLQTAHHNGPWPFFLRHKSTLPDDPFDRALQGEIVNETTTIRGICRQEIRAEVHARLYPIGQGADRKVRVMALLRQTGS